MEQIAEAPVSILYEDNHVLVAIKPAGIPSQADSSGDNDMLSLLKGYLAEKYHKPGNVYLGLVHRLDRPVGGIMIFARTSKAASRLSEQVRSGGFGKEYLAVVEGHPPGGKLIDWLYKDTERNQSCVVPPETPGSKRAELSYAPKSSYDELTLCSVHLETGRSHQIRVQLSHAGYPLWGDQKYNPRAIQGQWIGLFAHKLSFIHPVKKELMTFDEQPHGGIWDRFHQEG